MLSSVLCCVVFVHVCLGKLASRCHHVWMYFDVAGCLTRRYLSCFSLPLYIYTHSVELFSWPSLPIFRGYYPGQLYLYVNCVCVCVSLKPLQTSSFLHIIGRHLLLIVPKPIAMNLAKLGSSVHTQSWPR